MKKKLRVLVLMHEDLVPPDDSSGLDDRARLEFRTESDVIAALAALGHVVLKVGVRDDLAPLRREINAGRPDIVFNLLEEFQGQPVFDHNVVSYLELLRVPYTGCNPRGLVLARDKALSKKVLHYHRTKVPGFAVVPIGRKFRRPRGLPFPLIVKSLVEEASLGISKASVVNSDDKLAERVRFIHDHLRTDAIVEQFIDGRELYVAVLGNYRLKVLPVWELLIEKAPPEEPRIATRKVKWDPGYQERWGVAIDEAKDLPLELVRRLESTARRIYRVLGLSGYARIDFRLDASGQPYFLEANPNPDIARDAEFASAADAAGLGYEKLLQRIVGLGLQRASAA